MIKKSVWAEKEKELDDKLSDNLEKRDEINYYKTEGRLDQLRECRGWNEEERKESEETYIKDMKIEADKIRILTEKIKKRDEERGKVIEVIKKVCHSLGKPDWNGENHIYDVDGMYWKELSDKFKEKIDEVFNAKDD